MFGRTTTIDLCVLRDVQGDGWSVALCVEGTPRQVLARFDNRPEALAFAMRERNARDIDRGLELRVVCPDACPCYVEAPSVGREGVSLPVTSGSGR